MEDTREALLRWYDRNRRDLPWRSVRDPWAIWVAEVMLQQTRVDSAIPYWERFLARFPTPAALAEAPLDEVLERWAGLGYYARARNLHRAARQIVDAHDGRLPDDPVAFGALPGVGRYTCGAVQSIAFGHRLPALDGNVARVLCRLDRVETPPQAPTTRRLLWARAARLAAGPRPGDLNQALMELGATLCTPRSPRCEDCPLASRCQARLAGDEARLPLPRPAARRLAVCRLSGLVIDAAGVWLGRRPASGLLGGLWELPSRTVEGADSRALAALGLAPVEETPRVIRHTFTHRVWTVHTWRCEGRPNGDGYTALEPVAPSALSRIALTGPALKSLRAWNVEGAPRRRGAGRVKP